MVGRLTSFLCAFQINEEDKERLVNAHLGGDARRVVQHEDVESINTVD